LGFKHSQSFEQQASKRSIKLNQFDECLVSRLWRKLMSGFAIDLG
jgi:hypothetical protein